MRFWMLDRKLFQMAGLVLLAVILVGAWLFWSAGGRMPSAGKPDSSTEPVTVVPTEDLKPKDPDSRVDPGSAPFVPARTDFFVEYRLEREMTRGRQVELLQAVAQDPNADEAKRAAAQERLLQITRDLGREMGLESILRAKGFRDAVVFFQNDLVIVIVPEPFSEAETAEIINLVARGAGVKFENVMVIGHAAESQT
jgi:stage III sporulation protein AH